MEPHWDVSLLQSAQKCLWLGSRTYNQPLQIFHKRSHDGVCAATWYDNLSFDSSSEKLSLQYRLPKRTSPPQYHTRTSSHLSTRCHSSPLAAVSWQQWLHGMGPINEYVTGNQILPFKGKCWQTADVADWPDLVSSGSLQFFIEHPFQSMFFLNSYSPPQGPLTTK
jgi:hypothetical protein